MATLRSLTFKNGAFQQLADTDQLYSEPWQSPTLLNGWQAWNTARDNSLGLTYPGYYKDPYGVVRIQGVLTGGTANAVMFVLPQGYRPNRYLIFPVISGSTTVNPLLGLVHVKQDGSVLHVSGGTDYIALDPIQFRLF